MRQSRELDFDPGILRWRRRLADKRLVKAAGVELFHKSFLGSLKRFESVVRWRMRVSHYRGRSGVLDLGPGAGAVSIDHHMSS